MVAKSLANLDRGVTFGATCGFEWLVWYKISWLYRTTFVRQSTGIDSFSMMAWDIVSSNTGPLSCAIFRSNQYTESWYFIHLMLYGTNRGCPISKGVSTSGSRAGVTAVKKHACRP